MKKLTAAVLALATLFALASCAAEVTETTVTEPTPSEVTETAKITVEPRPTDAPYYMPEISGERWIGTVPVKFTNVLIVSGVDTATGTFAANRGYFQEPVGEDVLDYGFQFQLLRTVGENAFDMPADTEFFFKSCDVSYFAEPVKLGGAEEFAEKVAEGYVAWVIETADGAITSMTNIPWRERILYRILGVEPADAPQAILVRAQREIAFPAIEGNRRYDYLGLPDETLYLTEETEIFTDIWWNPAPDDQNVYRVPGTAEDIAVWYENYGRGAYIEKDSETVVSFYGIYMS